jgi:hypothetical protein
MDAKLKCKDIYICVTALLALKHAEIAIISKETNFFTKIHLCKKIAEF